MYIEHIIRDSRGDEIGEICYFHSLTSKAVEIKKYFLEEEDFNEVNIQKVEALLSGYDNITLIRNLSVDEKHRGRGLATELMNQAMEVGDVFVLMAYIEDSSFLEKWYSCKYGFKTRFHFKGLPVMICFKNQK